jgi:uncharacterized membrane protein YeaQ/YmgE (transglycosylase-associated protein family)
MDTAQEFKRGGWVVAVLGALGAVARLIITEERFKAIIWIRKGIAGAIVGTLVYFAVNPTNIDQLYKGIIYASSGALAPDIFEWLKSKFVKETK